MTQGWKYDNTINNSDFRWIGNADCVSNGNIIATVSTYNNKVFIYNILGTLIYTINEAGVTITSSLALSDTTLVVGISSNNTIRIYDISLLNSATTLFTGTLPAFQELSHYLSWRKSQISIYENTIAINDDNNGNIYVYNKNILSNIWEIKYYLSNNNATIIKLGNSNTLIVGNMNTNSVIVYRIPPSTQGQITDLNSIIEASLVPDNNIGSKKDYNFGESIAVYGDVLAISATGSYSVLYGVHDISGDTSTFNYHNESNNSQIGAVYIYKYNGNTWNKTYYIKAPNNAANTNYFFGGSLSIKLSSSNNKLLVIGGAYQESSPFSGVYNTDNRGYFSDEAYRAMLTYNMNNINNTGAVYVYNISNSDCIEKAYIKSNTIISGNAFGKIVEIINNNNIAIIQENTGNNNQIGNINVYNYGNISNPLDITYSKANANDYPRITFDTTDLIPKIVFDTYSSFKQLNSIYGIFAINATSNIPITDQSTRFNFGLYKLLRSNPNYSTYGVEIDNNITFRNIFEIDTSISASEYTTYIVIRLSNSDIILNEYDNTPDMFRFKITQQFINDVNNSNENNNSYLIPLKSNIFDSSTNSSGQIWLDRPLLQLESLSNFNLILQYYNNNIKDNVNTAIVSTYISATLSVPEPPPIPSPPAPAPPDPLDGQQQQSQQGQSNNTITNSNTTGCCKILFCNDKGLVAETNDSLVTNAIQQTIIKQYANAQYEKASKSSYYIVQPVFSSYSDYMKFLQSSAKYR